RVAWQDWYTTVDREFHALQKQCKTVFVAGLSMGGTLALRIAEKHPDDVAGLVLVNPATQLPWNAHFAPLLRHFIPALKAAVGSDIAKPGVEEHTYDVTPLNATNELLKLCTNVNAALDLVICPVLLYRSAVDHVLPPSSVQTVLRQISSEDISERVLARSWHVATMDYEKEELFAGSIDFFGKHAGSS
ncbi:MAG: alpha/beta fold hydrolase, partial [Propionibacteriaceae bacterium]|nr:alpha/beta fold hydrolase [Propionibacteriaceae bacterium]